MLNLKKKEILLKVLQLIFYICFISVWFKDNFAPLRSLRIKILFFLFPLLIVSGWLLILKIRKVKISFPLLTKQKSIWIGVIILVCLLLRLPFLMNYVGTMTSDEALFYLEGKHIAEGKVPPICSYGQLYHGTSPSHLFALVFKIFGNSVLAFKLTIFFLYLAFIIFHFLFLLNFFPLDFALLVAIFYGLPFGYLVQISLDGEFVLSLLFLLGLAIIYLSYLIAERNQEKYLPWLGFLIGFALWTNPILIYFVLVSLITLFLKYRWNLKKYLIIFFYALVGFWPQLLIEIFYRFHLIKFLTAGELVINAEKIKKTFYLMASLLTFSPHPSRIVLVLGVLVGFFAILGYVIKTNQVIVLKIYPVYFLVFLIIYLLSGHSNRYLIRYLYPLFFCWPLFLLAPFVFLRPKVRIAAFIGLCLLLFFGYNFSTQYHYFLAVKESHQNLTQIVSFLKETKEKYWKADFWTAYLITALTGEEIIVATTTHRRYFPYELYYYNLAIKDNFIFLRGEGSNERWHARMVISLLESLKVGYKKKEIGDCWLIYNIESPVVYLDEPGPSSLPQIEGPQMELADGYLLLTFKNVNPSKENSLFWLTVEIPPFSKVGRQFSLQDKEIKIRCPFPPKNSFDLIYYLDYWGTIIPASYQKRQVSLPSSIIETLSRPEIVYLYGFDFVPDYEGKRMRTCEKEVKIELNRPLLPREKLCLVLHSPFNFSHLHWYGRFVQEVEVFINGQLVSKYQLKDGRNEIKISGEGVDWQQKNNVIDLKFKHHFRFDFRPRVKTAAVLEKIYFERSPFPD